jgi:hypothetical protein
MSLQPIFGDPRFEKGDAKTIHERYTFADKLTSDELRSHCQYWNDDSEWLRGVVQAFEAPKEYYEAFRAAVPSVGKVERNIGILLL